ncbi:SufE family protein [Lacibacterium aquatile]|uniref:SufE family protein n=1 Tax=Lacibacterium aquatile TaxID=1168082 RepID=A0ABW5DPP6_9PROT
MSLPETSIKDAQQELIDTFAFLPDWQEKYQYIIELGQQLAPMDEAAKTDDILVRGCQSRVWMRPRLEAGRLRFDANSDAIIVSGLIAMLKMVYDNRPPREVLETPPDFIAEIGLSRHLSQSRANGLMSMLQRLREAAVQYGTAV